MTRKLGYTGYVLNHDALTSKVSRILQLQHGLTSEEMQLIEVPKLLLLDVNTYRLGVVRTEGVGAYTKNGGMVRIGIDIPSVTEFYSVSLAPQVLRQLATSEMCDLAEWVRVFGARLDDNVMRWQRFADGGE